MCGGLDANDATVFFFLFFFSFFSEGDLLQMSSVFTTTVPRGEMHPLCVDAPNDDDEKKSLCWGKKFHFVGVAV